MCDFIGCKVSHAPELHQDPTWTGSPLPAPCLDRLPPTCTLLGHAAPCCALLSPTCTCWLLVTAVLVTKPFLVERFMLSFG